MNILITGVDRGVGEALMNRFLEEEEHAVIGTYFAQAPAEQERFTAVQLDLSEPDSVYEATEAIGALDVEIDVIINNAGVLIDIDETSVVIDDLRATLEVNVIGTIDFTERLRPLLSERAHVVNITSTAGSLELAGKKSHKLGYYPAYKISKAAMNMYTKTLAHEYRDAEVTVSSVHPGWVQTAIGGDDAALTPAESAEGIYQMAVSPPPSGGFWFDGEALPW